MCNFDCELSITYSFESVHVRSGFITSPVVGFGFLVGLGFPEPVVCG